MLIVGERFEVVLEYDTECHGSMVFCKLFDKMEAGKRASHFKAWRDALDKVIPAGKKFVNYVFVDTDDGEVLHFNVIEWLDAYMLKFKLYPTIISEPIVKYYGDKNNRTNG
jgi:hypothetical protein